MEKLKLSKSNKIAFGVLIGLLLLFIAFASWNIFSSAKEILNGKKGSSTTGVEQPISPTVSESNIVDTTTYGTYQLHANPTDLQVEIYKDLMDAMDGYDLDKASTELNYRIVQDVAKSFIADFYTWTNKLGNYDVGGLDYIYGNMHANVFLLARDYFYADLDLYLKNHDAKDLLEVSSIDIVSCNYSSEYTTSDGQTFDHTYYIELEWSYKDSSVLDTSKYQQRTGMMVAYNPATKRYEIMYSHHDW